MNWEDFDYESLEEIFRDDGFVEAEALEESLVVVAPGPPPNSPRLQTPSPQPDWLEEAVQGLNIYEDISEDEEALDALVELAVVQADVEDALDEAAAEEAAGAVVVEPAYVPTEEGLYSTLNILERAGRLGAQFTGQTFSHFLGECAPPLRAFFAFESLDAVTDFIRALGRGVSGLRVTQSRTEAIRVYARLLRDASRRDPEAVEFARNVYLRPPS